MKPIKVMIQRDCALGETLTAEVTVDLDHPEPFLRTAAMLDARLIALNYRVADAMKLEVRWGPEIAAKVRSVIDVLLGAKSIKQFEEQKDLAPDNPREEITDNPRDKAIRGIRSDM